MITIDVGAGKGRPPGRHIVHIDLDLCLGREYGYRDLARGPIPTRPRPVTAAERARMVRLYRAGNSIAEVARLVGRRSADTVRTVLIAARVPRRPARRPKRSAHPAPPP